MKGVPHSPNQRFLVSLSFNFPPPPSSPLSSDCDTVFYILPSAPLSAPSAPFLLSATHDSLTLSFNLPSEGTPPVLHIIVNFSSPTHFQWKCQGVEDRALGAQLDCTVPRLQADTQYTLAVFALGHAGRGNTSQEVTFTTSESPFTHPTFHFLSLNLSILSILPPLSPPPPPPPPLFLSLTLASLSPCSISGQLPANVGDSCGDISGSHDGPHHTPGSDPSLRALPQTPPEETQLQAKW